MGEYDLHIGIYGDETHLANALRRTREQVRQTAKQVQDSGVSIEQMFDRIKNAAGKAFLGFSAASFIKEMATVRGEFQKLEVAFTTMLGNAEKANALMEQLTKTAAITPFDLQGVTMGAKQLLAYGIEAEKVNDTLVHLGDIAAGLSLPLNDLVYLYGTTMIQGRMFTQDLRQFQNRGIPIAEELAKVIGTTKDKIGEMVTAGKVGAKEFNQAIMAMSSAGGRFAGLMENQSKTITGQISNLQDAVQMMFNNIGKQSEGIINGALSVAGSLVENYEKVGKILVSLVATYGTYKAAVMTVTAIQGLQTAGIAALTTAETIHYGWLVLCEKAQALLNKTMLANPYVLVAVLIAGATAALLNMKNMQDLVNDAEGEYNRKKDEAIQKEQEHMNRLNELISVAGNEQLSTDARRGAMIQLMNRYPELFKNYRTEIEALKDIAYWKAKIVEIETGKSITNANNELRDVNRRIEELEGIHTDSFINSAGGRTYTGRNRSQEEEAELTMLRKQRDKLQNDINKKKATDYMASLTGISNADLQKQINERRNLLAVMTTDEKKYGKVSYGGAIGVYNRAEVEAQLKQLEWEQQRRTDIKKNQTIDFKTENEKLYKNEAETLKKIAALHDPNKRKNSKEEVEVKSGVKKLASELSADEYLEALEFQQKKVDAAKKKLDEERKALNGGTTPKSRKDHTAEQDATRRQKLFEQDIAAEESQSRQKRELRDALRELEIASEEDNAKRELLQMQKDHEDKLEAIREQADQWKKEAYKAAEERWNATNKNKTKTFADTAEGKAGWQAQSLTPEQEQTIQARVDAENAIYNRGIRERLEDEAKAMTSFLKQYGSFEEQRRAITKEYDAKISKEKNIWLRKQLEEEKKAALNAVNSSQMKFEINWEAVFGNIESYSKDALLKIREQLNSWIDSTRDDRTVEEMKELYEALEKINGAIQKKGGLFGGLKDALKNSKAALKELEKAKQDYEVNVYAYGLNSAQAQNAKGRLNAAQWNYDQSQQQVVEARNQMFDNMATLSNALKNLGEEEEASLSSVGSVVGSLINTLSSTNTTIGNLIAAILSLMEAIGKDGRGFFQNLFRNIGSAVYGVNDALNPVANAYREIHGDHTLLGKFFAADALSDNTTKDYDALREQYDYLLKVWDEIIAKKREYVQESWGIDAINAEREAIELLNKQIEAERLLADERLGAGGGYWSHSMGYRMWGGSYKDIYGRTWSDVAEEINGELGVNLNSMQDFLNLTSDQLQWIKEHYPTLWAAMDDQFREHLENIIKYGEEIVNATEEASKKLIGISKDEAFDSLRESLHELANGSEDTFEDIEKNYQKMLNKMVIDNLIMKELEKDLEDWYSKLVAVQEKRNETGDDYEYQQEINQLTEEYHGIVEKGRQRVEQYRDLGIIQAVEEAERAFGNLRDTFLDTLTDMEDDAEAFRKRLEEIMVKDVIEKQVLDVPFTINGMTFDNFDAYIKSWNERYVTAVKSGNQEAIDALIDELVQARELTVEAAEQWRERLKEVTEDTSFEDMNDSWVSTLMDMSSTAEDWSQNIGKVMVQRIVEQMIAPTMLKPLLEGLQGAFNTAMSAEGATWESVVNDADVQSWLEKIKEAFPEAQNLIKSIMESLGLITAEGLGDIKSNFVSALMDIEKSAEDLGKEIAKTMYEQMIEKFVDSKYGDELKALSDEWADALKSGDTSKIEEIRQKIIALYQAIGNDDAIRQLTDDLKELNDIETPFDNLRSSYLSAVMDMKKTTKDFTDDIMQMIAEAFVDSFVLGAAFDEKLKYWKEQYGKITSDESLSEKERLRQLKALGELIAGERDNMKAEANNIMTMLGLNQDDTESATMNMADKATYDQFELYLGIANAHLMVSEQHKQISQEILTTLQNMNSLTSGGTNYGEQIFMRLGTTNEYLLATKRLVGSIEAKMDLINQQLSRL